MRKLVIKSIPFYYILTNNNNKGKPASIASLLELRAAVDRSRGGSRISNSPQGGCTKIAVAIGGKSRKTM